MRTHDADTIQGAADVLARRWCLTQAAATAALADIADETGVHVLDLAELVESSDRARRSDY